MTRSPDSAGILLFRRTPRGLEVFLVHPGGPYFARKDGGAWSLPKGEAEASADLLGTAIREFAEETGQPLTACATRVAPRALGSIRQRGGKRVWAWAVEGDWPAGVQLQSQRFELEWPPGSGRRQHFPEVDRGGFFAVEEARSKLNPAQSEFLDRLVALHPDGAHAAR
jgi:predicted NUDIX family NTP pyrophosphohydrolase